jgi:hypothetical protein
MRENLSMKKRTDTTISLAPLSFDEVIKTVVQVKPQKNKELSVGRKVTPSKH